MLKLCSASLRLRLFSQRRDISSRSAARKSTIRISLSHGDHEQSTLCKQFRAAQGLIQKHQYSRNKGFSQHKRPNLVTSSTAPTSDGVGKPPPPIAPSRTAHGDGEEPGRSRHALRIALAAVLGATVWSSILLLYILSQKIIGFQKG